jgi:hypothetical protein
MLAHTRLHLISVSVILLLAGLPSLLSAQIHGVAPSVTSFGFGGSSNPTPGVPASVTSVGPNGFACCSGPLISPFFVLPQGPRFDGTRSRGTRFHDHLRFPVGMIVPAYIPYAVPYPVPFAEDDGEDDDSAAAAPAYSRRGQLAYDSTSLPRDAAARRQGPGKAAADREVASSKESAPATVPDPAASAAAQPTTLLIYKDGHNVEVQNYAIVGDTLFDFTGGLSHKILLADLDLPATQRANDARGVEFQVPAQKSQ